MAPVQQASAVASAPSPAPPPNGAPSRAIAAAPQPQPSQVHAGAQIATAAAQERALVPVAAENVDVETNATVFGPAVARLPVELDVAIPLRGFRVKDLLALEPGRLIESAWSNGVDLPLAAGDVQLAWSEFEVIDTALVVRLTRLA